MRRERLRRDLTIGALVVLSACGLIARIASFMSESLDYDTYALLLTIDLPYSEYINGGFAWSLHTHYWWTAQILGIEVWAFRLLPAFVSLVAFFLVSWLVWRVRPGDYVALIFAIFSLRLMRMRSISWATQ